jgi:outer membrane protein assembly factor BamB
VRLEVGPVAPARALLVGPQHQGISPYRGPARLRLQWARALPAAGEVPDGPDGISPGMYASPIQGADGTVYAVALGGVLTAWRPDGALRWQQPLGGHVLGSPALSEEQARLFIPTFDGRLLCLDAHTGEVLWTRSLGAEVRASPVAHGERVLISALDQTYAFDALGRMIWRHHSGDETFHSTPALSPDGATVYVGSWGGALMALDAETGARLWTHLFSVKQSVTQPCVDAQGRVFVLGSPRSGPSSLYGFSAQGLLLFARPLRGQGFVFPSLSARGLLLVADQDGHLYGFDAASGDLRFEMHLADDTFRGSVVSDAAGDLYAHTAQGQVWRLSPEGEPLARLFLPAGGRSTPLIGLSQHNAPRLYVTVGERWLIAIGE